MPYCSQKKKGLNSDAIRIHLQIFEDETKERAEVEGTVDYITHNFPWSVPDCQSHG